MAASLSKLNGLMGFLMGAAAWVHAQSPLSLPLLQLSDIQYAGAFKVPSAGEAPVQAQTDYSIGTMGYNPGSPGSIFISCHAQGSWAAEISIPEPSTAKSLDQLKTANFIQKCHDPLAGSSNPTKLFNDGNGYYLGGFLPYKGKLIVTAYLWYDAGGAQNASHYVKATTDLAKSDASGPFDVSADGRGTGFVSGYMHPIPAEWQALLGGPILAGQSGFSIISRGSHGPDGFAFDPAGLGKIRAPSSPLFYYPDVNPTLGDWDATFNGTTVKWNQTGWYKNVMIIDGTRTALAFGHQGVGAYCYGEGALGGKCADPAFPDIKGDHAYPYRLQIMAFDVKDFVDVRAGTKKPWQVQPYAIWPINPPFGGILGGGAGFDPVKRRVFFAVKDVDQSRPIIYTYDIKKGSTSGIKAPGTPASKPGKSGFFRANGTLSERTASHKEALFRLPDLFEAK